MAVINPDVILISSDDEDGRNLVTSAVINPEIVLIPSDDEGLESDDHEEDDVEKLNEGERIVNCDRSGVFHQGGNGFHALSLYECKTYLWKHRMNVYGSKEECIQRIEECERLKDGKGESFYPKSSFSINCTGDACRGDVVLFKQNMYNSHRNIIGRRTVAGRIVKESYDASSQHTFSVEVLWSEWFKKLDPLSILLVKGCNLYRFGTFRQPWKSEAERSKVLDEKHERGKAARLKRKLRETEFVSGGNKGKKLHKVSHRVQSQSKHLNGLHKHKYANEDTTANNQAVRFQNAELESFTGHSHHNNEQGPSQVLSEPPDHQHHNSESPDHRSKDEKAKLHFPESSFSINCTGDARERDFVLFKQQVFLRGKSAGEKRTIAGRIVKVRRCESSDKHRFLIKVLWTIPSINNRRRFTLQVRSHNLYKFGTFRQPWKNEAMRSKTFQEKHGLTMPKRKLKKADISLNKNKGAKRQKVSRNGPSSKGKAATATPVKKTKTGSKKKNVQLQKTRRKKSKQQAFQLHPNPNMNLNSSLRTNPKLNPSLNLISSSTSNPIPSPHLNPNQHTDLNTPGNQNPTPCQNPNTDQSQNSNTRQNPNPNSTNPNVNPNSNPTSSTTSNPNPSPHPNQRQNPKKCQNPKTHRNPKKSQNPPCPQLNPNQRTNLNTRQNPSPKTHRNPKKSQNPNLKTHRDTKKRKNPQGLQLNPNQSTNLNTHQNPNPNPHLNNYMPAHQQQESSLALPCDATFMPNQPPVWFPPNQSSFGFPGYVGQLEPNNFLMHLLAYNMTVQMLTAALWYQHPR